LNSPRYNAAIALYQNKGDVRLFVVGGQDVEGKPMDTIETLEWNNRDKTDFELIALRLPHALCKSELIYYDYKLFIVGG
jgi:hypothetical protein